MPNVFTDTTSATWDRLVETAFDRAVEYALRDVPAFSDVADKRPERQAMPGDVVTFTLHNDLALATTPLSETVDPDAVGMPVPTRVSVTINEYGNTSLHSLALRNLAFTEPEMEIAMLIARNMIDSIDKVLRVALDSGTNVLSLEGGQFKTSGNQVNNITTSDVFDADCAATAVTLLRRRKVVPRDGDLMVAVVHPDVAYDIMRESPGNSWVNPHQYVDTANIYRGEIGTYLGAKYIQTTRGQTAANSGSINYYTSYYLAKQALAIAEVVDPHVVVGPQTDKLRRFFPLGWHAQFGTTIYRNEALQLVKTSSTVQGL